MLKILFYTSLSACLLLVACNNNEKEEEQQKKDEIEALKAEVIGIHDELMPKMDKIMNLKSQLEQEVINISDSTRSDSTAIQIKLINQLEEADAAMMVWMRNYDPMMEGMTHEEKTVYLENKNNDIKQVKEQMLSAISQAEEHLQQN